jgi:hypothetical protein
MLQVLAGVLDLHLACLIRDLWCKLLEVLRVLLDLLHPLAEVELIELDASLDTFKGVAIHQHVPCMIFLRCHGLV